MMSCHQSDQEHIERHDNLESQPHNVHQYYPTCIYIYIYIDIYWGPIPVVSTQ